MKTITQKSLSASVRELMLAMEVGKCESWLLDHVHTPSLRVIFNKERKILEDAGEGQWMWRVEDELFTIARIK